MNTSPTMTSCPLANETGTEIVSPTGSELTSISLDVEQANDDASSSAVDASPKAKTMKEVLLICGRGLAVAVVIALALAGKSFVACAHNDPPGIDDIMNAHLGIDSNKQVALLKGDGNNVAGYDFTKVGGSGGMPTERSLDPAQDPIIYDYEYEFTKVGDGLCLDSNNYQVDAISFPGIALSFSGIADVDACKAKCAACPGQGQAAGRELRGIYYDSFVCSCHLDDGDCFYASDCTGAFDAVSLGLSIGAICNTDNPNPGINSECWKVVDSNLQCPTPAPTNEPTSSPSMSPTQSPSTAPPSMAPTASPTASPTAPPSKAPTASPTEPPSMAPTASPTASPTAPRPRSMAPTETPTKTPTAPPTAQPNSAPTKASAKSGKVAKVAKANGIVDLQVQEMKSGGSSVSISPHVGILALIVASRNLYLLL